jgi:hypothetical protein
VTVVEFCPLNGLTEMDLHVTLVQRREMPGDDASDMFARWGGGPADEPDACALGGEHVGRFGADEAGSEYGDIQLTSVVFATRNPPP